MVICIKISWVVKDNYFLGYEGIQYRVIVFISYEILEGVQFICLIVKWVLRYLFFRVILRMKWGYVVEKFWSLQVFSESVFIIVLVVLVVFISFKYREWFCVGLGGFREIVLFGVICGLIVVEFVFYFFWVMECQRGYLRRYLQERLFQVRWFWGFFIFVCL